MFSCLSRNALCGVVTTVIFSVTVLAQTPNYQNNINATGAWLANDSRLSDGSILFGQNSTEIEPYLGNLAAIGWTKDSTYYPDIENWMNWYWANVSWPDRWGIYGSIDDFDVTSNSNGTYTESKMQDSPSQHHPDSTDSYAGTFLSLAWAYYQTGDNAPAYINSIEEQLDYIGEVVLATKQTSANNLTWARPDWNIEYLMDNTEAYAGLRDLSSIYEALGDSTKASFYQTNANQMLTGIGRYLWSPQNNYYFQNTTNSANNGTIAWTTYSDAVSQLYPIANGVIAPSSNQAQQLYKTFNSYWAVSGSKTNNWTTLAIPDTYPWAIVAYVAALMGDTGNVNAYINAVQNVYVNHNFNGGSGHSWSCNEAGWFMRANAYMLGK